MRVENNNVSGQNHDPEQIDLIDLLVQLWRGKMTIIISVIVANAWVETNAFDNLASIQT